MKTIVKIKRINNKNTSSVIKRCSCCKSVCTYEECKNNNFKCLFCGSTLDKIRPDVQYLENLCSSPMSTTEVLTYIKKDGYTPTGTISMIKNLVKQDRRWVAHPIRKSILSLVNVRGRPIIHYMFFANK